MHGVTLVRRERQREGWPPAGWPAMHNSTRLAASRARGEVLAGDCLCTTSVSKPEPRHLREEEER